MKKSEKTHELWRNYESLLIYFLENIIFDPQITICRVHPLQILSRSDYCITTEVM